VRTLLAKPAFTYDQLSAALGIPRGSIGPTRARSLARLRRNHHLAQLVGPIATQQPLQPDDLEKTP
jgi:hypothetical protein